MRATFENLAANASERSTNRQRQLPIMRHIGIGTEWQVLGTDVVFERALLLFYFTL
jgi:hypothetical protein